MRLYLVAGISLLMVTIWASSIPAGNVDSFSQGTNVKLPFSAEVNPIGRLETISVGENRLLIRGNMWVQFWTGPEKKKGRTLVRQGSPLDKEKSPIKFSEEDGVIVASRNGLLADKDRVLVTYEERIEFKPDGTIHIQYNCEFLEEIHYRYLPVYEIDLPKEVCAGKGLITETEAGITSQKVIPLEWTKENAVRGESYKHIKFATTAGVLEVIIPEESTNSICFFNVDWRGVCDWLRIRIYPRERWHLSTSQYRKKGDKERTDVIFRIPVSKGE